MDDLYDDAVMLVVEHNRVSVSFLQRKFMIGFNRAFRIIDEMEKNGVISGPIDDAPRKVLKNPPL